jgi:probable phosphoglycerate mutase
MRLILIRHGQTPSNVEGLLDTRIPGPGLTELGVEQAAAVPAALIDHSIDAIYASIQVRTQITAEPLSASLGLPVTVREGIREVSSGDWEMLNDEDSVRGYMSVVYAWADGDVHRRIPGGESGAEVFARYDSVIADAAAAGHATVVFFSHGAVIRSWVGNRAVNVGAQFIADNPLRNTGIVIVDGSPEDGWSVLTWMGEAIGGPALDDAGTAGPVALSERELAAPGTSE